MPWSQSGGKIGRNVPDFLGPAMHRRQHMRCRQRQPAFRLQCPVLGFKGGLIAINQILQGAGLQAARLDLFLQGAGNIMLTHLAPFDLGNGIAPPLEPNQAQPFLGDHQPDPRQLIGERIKSRQRLPLVVLCIAAGNPAVLVCAKNPLVDRGPLRFGKRAGRV